MGQEFASLAVRARCLANMSERKAQAGRRSNAGANMSERKEQAGRRSNAGSLEQHQESAGAPMLAGMSNIKNQQARPCWCT